MKKLKLKVCGMRDPNNIQELTQVSPDYLGFIFYPPSSRYVRPEQAEIIIHGIPAQIKKTGVFVNETTEKIKQIYDLFRLNAVQLHGAESPEQCLELKSLGYEIIKAFSVDEFFDFSKTLPYVNSTDFYLFDTRTTLPGGSGKKFNWQKLNEYVGKTPFFLSGGIDETDAQKIGELQTEQLYGIDINSRFEVSPAIKDIIKIKHFIQNIENRSK